MAGKDIGGKKEDKAQVAVGLKSERSKSRKQQVPEPGADEKLESAESPTAVLESPSPIDPWPAGGEPSLEGPSRSPSRVTPVAIHLVLFLLFGGSFIYNIWWDISRGNYVITDWIYLTHWNLTFQVIFCAIELMSDFNQRFAEQTASLRAKLFHSIVTPFCFFVCSFFWMLCLIDENLVRPEDPEDRCEEWYNQVVHTLIVPAAILQSLAAYHRPPPPIVSFTITVLCGFIYTCWSVMWGVLFDLWSYELFRILSVPGFMLLILLSAGIMCVLQTIGRVVHQRLWQAHVRRRRVGH